MSSFHFQLFCTKWWYLAPGKFFLENSHLFPRYWGPNFSPFRAKSDSLNETATLKANMCQEHCWSVSFFIFWKYGLNYTRKSKFWPSYACCCVEIMAWNHKNLNFCQTLGLHISRSLILLELFLPKVLNNGAVMPSNSHFMTTISLLGVCFLIPDIFAWQWNIFVVFM